MTDGLLWLTCHILRNSDRLTHSFVLTVLIRTGGGRGGPGRFSWFAGGGAGDDYMTDLRAMVFSAGRDHVP